MCEESLPKINIQNVWAGEKEGCFCFRDQFRTACGYPEEVEVWEILEKGNQINIFA